MPVMDEQHDESSGSAQGKRKVDDMDVLAEVDSALDELVPNSTMEALLNALEKHLKNTPDILDAMRSDIEERARSMPHDMIVNNLSERELLDLIELEEDQMKQAKWEMQWYRVGNQASGEYMDTLINQAEECITLCKRAIEVAYDPKPYEEMMDERIELTKRAMKLRKRAVQQARDVFM